MPFGRQEIKEDSLSQGRPSGGSVLTEREKIIFKSEKKEDYRKNGHRQQFTEVRIKEIGPLAL
jgi:hypothetical protein